MEKTVIAGEQLESTYDQSFATIYQRLAREPGELEGLLNGAVLLKPLMDSLNASTNSTPTEARCSKGLLPLPDTATLALIDRKRVGWGKMVSVRVELGGR